MDVATADRSITGPVITWMIENQVSFLGETDHSHALGGLVGSLFFAGYMLTQFPGGYLGDKYGHRTMIVISILWAGVATIISGFVTSLVGFIALRVITGLGEGAYYSNDRTLIAEKTPFEKRSFGMGVVITGLSIGITLAMLLSPYLIDWGQVSMPGKNGWRMPFFVLGAATLIVGAGRSIRHPGGCSPVRPPASSSMRFSLFPRPSRQILLLSNTGVPLSVCGT